MAGHPLFTVMAALSLAIGIGANTAIYSFMDAILLRSLPARNPESLVSFNWYSKGHPPVAQDFSGSTFKDPRTGNTSGHFPYPAYELPHSDLEYCHAGAADRSDHRPGANVRNIVPVF